MLSVREIQVHDIDLLVKYWTESTDEHMLSMGVDLAKIPKPESLRERLTQQIKLPLVEKTSYAFIWLLNEAPIGHCNVNQIVFGEQAFMHLHLWDATTRQKGLGQRLVKLSLAHFFKDLKLARLFCEPYALNPAPNRTLEKIGFKFVKAHTCIPGTLNFEQLVHRWVLTREVYLKL